MGNQEKLLPILDKEYKNHTSFINTGPVMWVDKESVFGPSIYTDFKTILTCMPEVIERLNAKTIYKTQDNRIGKVFYSRKEFLFYIIYLITAIGPVSELELVDIIKKSIRYGDADKDKNEISFILSLTVALGVIKTIEYKNITLYFCSEYKSLYKNDSTKSTLLLSQTARAICLSDLMQIPNYKSVMYKVTNNAT